MAISYLSLTLSSAKLFFSNRLGIFKDVDPTFKMIVVVAPAIAIFLLAPILSLVLMSTYFNELVIVVIGVIVAANAVVLKLPCLDRFLFDDLLRHYGFDQLKLGKDESDTVLMISILTS